MVWVKISFSLSFNSAYIFKTIFILSLLIVRLFSFVKKEVRVLVTEPIRPIPTSINTIAIIQPQYVAGVISPYPTVVVVTNAHQIPSCSVIFSVKEIKAPPEKTKIIEVSIIYLKPLVLRKQRIFLYNLESNDMKRVAFKSLVNLRSLKNLKVLKMRRAELKGSMAIKSRIFSLINWILLVDINSLTA